MLVVSFVIENINCIKMSLRGSEYYEQHFLLSKEIVQFILGVRRHQNSKDLLFFLCVVTIYVLPMIVHQVKVFFYMPDNFIVTHFFITVIIINYCYYLILLLVLT